jgi:hypothetical protein
MRTAADLITLKGTLVLSVASRSNHQREMRAPDEKFPKLEPAGGGAFDRRRQVKDKESYLLLQSVLMIPLPPGT